MMNTIPVPQGDVTEAGRLAMQDAARNAMDGTGDKPQEVQPDLGFEEPEELVKALEDMHRSQGYLVIRDHITPKMNTAIRKNTELYKRFQAIKKECKDSWDYDHRTTMMFEVNRGLTNLYGIILNILAAHQNVHSAELDEVRQAINNIEERLGFEQTKWNGGADNDAGYAGDVPPVQTDSGGTE